MTESTTKKVLPCSTPWRKYAFFSTTAIRICHICPFVRIADMASVYNTISCPSRIRDTSPESYIRIEKTVIALLSRSILIRTSSPKDTGSFAYAIRIIVTSFLAYFFSDFNVVFIFDNYPLGDSSWTCTLY